MRPIQHILVALDFDPVSLRALDHALDLAASTGASVTVMHAHPMPLFNLPDGGYVPAPEQIAKAMAEAQRKLDEVVAQRRGKNVPMTTLLRSGDARDEIARMAEERDADLVVIGTHGRGPLAGALLGSVAPHVLRTATRPVLVVPSHG